MTNSERAAYIRGLMEGLELDPKAKETKLFNAIIDLLDDLCLSMEEMEDAHDELCGQVDEIDEDLGELEEEFYEFDDDDCDCDCGCGCDCDCDGGCCDEDEIEKVKKPAWVSFIIAVVFTLVAVFTPTTKTACAIYFVDYLQENKDARELPDKVLKSANLYFDKLIEDLDEEKKTE